MPRRLKPLACLLPVALMASTPLAAAGADDAAEQEFFESRIRPVLIDYCYECHSNETDEPAGGLRLDTRAGIRQGGELGPAVVPNDPGDSLILSALRYESLEMPPDGRLDDDVIADFERWIEHGAADPRTEDPAPKHSADDSPSTDNSESAADSESPAELWSLQPVTRPHVPQADNYDWSRTEIDRFILARLRNADLAPVADGSTPQVLRRLSFAILGLPPTPDVLNAHREQTAADAVAAVVDDWLQSPQFGERWARHWLDVVRYGESAGSSRDVLMLYSWRYRDYVIDAFNTDMPYDQFLREQIAGDLLPADSDAEKRRQLIATGLLAIGSKSLNGGNVSLDLVDDQINVVSRTVMGLTVSCARCHDHKFDPIPTADYYALAGIFRNTETFFGGDTKRPKNSKDAAKVYFSLNGETQRDEKQEKKLRSQLAEVQKSIRALERRRANADQNDGENADAIDEQLSDQQAKRKRLQQQLASLPQPEWAFVTQDADKPRNWPIQIRGEKNRNGDAVPRGFLSCVALRDTPQIPEDESGRRQLADWITSPDHPLTARVFVNRVWQHLFGRGLVESVDNFGRTGSPPTHPELVDWLADRFVHHHRWSLKSLIREIVSSRTWQLSADWDESGWQADPENTLCWRARRRRLEAEAIRDAMLAVAGTLDLRQPEGSLVQQIGEGEVGRNINTSVLDKPFPHRSVYLPIIRGLVPEMLQVFDFPEPSNPQGRRTVTNVPTQSLFLMNDPFVISQATALAERVRQSASDDTSRIAFAWQTCFGRLPTESDTRAALALLNREAGADEAEGNRGNRGDTPDPWTTLCHALLASAEFRFVD